MSNDDSRANIESTNLDSVDNSLAKMQTDQWSRVSPLAILYFFAKTLYNLVNSFLIYSLPAIAASYSTLKANPGYIIIGVVTLLALILIVSIAKYWFYFYKFTNARVEIKQGVFKKLHLDLPFKKIQNVKIVQPIYYRFNHYCFIELDTAGSAQQEAKIVALPLSLAESFKKMILQIKQTLPANTNSADLDDTTNNIESDKEVLLNKRSLQDLVIHGISNNRVWIFLGFLAPFYNTIVDNIGVFLDSVGVDFASYFDYQSLSVGIFVLHVLSIVMLIMLVIVSFSVIGSIFVFYNYRLSRLGDRYIRRSGLLTKHEISMRLSRIQIAIQQQDWLDILINRTNLRFEQNASGSAGAGQAQNMNSASKLIVPSVTLSESMALIQDTFKVEDFDNIDFAAISTRFVVRAFAFPVLPFIGILVAIGVGNQVPITGWFLIVSLALILIGLVWLRWWRWGYAFSDQYVYIRKGLFGVNYYVFPIGKTQQINLKQSIFMRRRKLADIQYILASGAHSVPLIPQHIAIAQVDMALLVVARDKPAWM